MATVFVIGAGPAGLFAAQKLALAGHEVVISNRDIKPGGLAEYGIIGHRIAELSVHRFINDVAGYLRQALALQAISNE